MTDRQTSRPVDPQFLARWSPRAFDGSELSEQDLLTLFDAARWAPSAFNAQPWRFLYARRGDAHWQGFLDILIPFNASWAQNAAALVFILSDSLNQSAPDKDPTPNHSHSFDAGAAWACLALQATTMGLHTHGMTGVDFDKARSDLQVPDRFRIEAAIAIGRIAPKETLPEALQAREEPSDRKPIEAIAFHGPAGAQLG